MAVPPVTRLLAEFATETPLTGVPEKVLNRAKLTVLDTVGVPLAAASEPAGALLSRFVMDRNEAGDCTIIGSATTVGTMAAALANGNLANALDFDEGLHLATHCLPAALAVGEAMDSSGADVLRAYIVGRECGARLTQAIDGRRREGIGPTSRGWWHVGIVGPVAASIAAGAILGLNVKEQQRAIGLATCASGGFRRNMGTMAKSLHSGLGASHGVQAALLARAGATADEAILEAPLGLASATTAGDGADWDVIVNQLGRPFELAGHLPLKKYPVCTPIHALLDALLSLTEENDIAWHDIEAVYGNLHEFSLFRGYPADSLEAAFSPRFIVAAALVAGGFGLDELAVASIEDERVRELAKKVRKSHDSTSVRLILKGGIELSARVGSTPRLTDRAGILAKYRACSSKALSPEAGEESLKALQDLESLSSIRSLTALLHGRS